MSSARQALRKVVEDRTQTAFLTIRNPDTGTCNLSPPEMGARIHEL